MGKNARIIVGLLLLPGCGSGGPDLNQPSDADSFVGIWTGTEVLSGYSPNNGMFEDKVSGTVGIAKTDLLVVSVDYRQMEPGACALKYDILSPSTGRLRPQQSCEDTITPWGSSIMFDGGDLDLTDGTLKASASGTVCCFFSERPSAGRTATLTRQ